jgi:membrane-associated phospholipid phosphatase
MRNYLKYLQLILALTLFSFPIESSAQLTDSLVHEQVKPQNKKIVKSFVAPTLLIGAGTYFTVDDHLRYEIRDQRNKHYPTFHHSVDNILPAVPVAFVYGLNFIGIKSENDFTNRTLILLKTELLTLALTIPLKELTHVTRPDNSNDKSFPSAHTAHAFAAATFMAKEFRSKSIWYGVGAYTLATGVGVMRILNNRHWVSDVMAGAGIGILSANIVYLTHQHRWGKKNNLTIIPTYSNGPGVYLCYLIK